MSFAFGYGPPEPLPRIGRPVLVSKETTMSQGLSASPGAAPHAALPVGTPVWVVSAIGDLDEAAAARLLRACEARLHLLDIGQAMLDHLVVDLSHPRRTTPSPAPILDHARIAADRRHVGVPLVGVRPLMARSSLQVRACLGRWTAFPPLDAAHTALNPPGGVEGRSPRRAVDPDAIVFTPPPPPPPHPM